MTANRQHNRWTTILAFVGGTVLSLFDLWMMSLIIPGLSSSLYRLLMAKSPFNWAIWLLISLAFGLVVAALSAASPSAIRYKIILAFVLSLALSITGVELVLTFAFLTHDLPMIGALLTLIRDTIGALPVIAALGILLFVIIFFALSAGMIKYITELSRAIHEIADGRFDAPIPEWSPDELGMLSQSLSTMAKRLRVSIDQEREAERARSELVTSVSHDLRTPLTSMLGYLELVDSDRYDDEVELRHYVAIAHAKCQQLKRMIDQLFEFTRTSHGAFRITRRRVNLAEMLQQLAEEFVPTLQSDGMTCNLRLTADRVSIQADSDLLVRVFENLISNAIRYGRAGGAVDLELEHSADQAIVRVINYGEPIPERDLPHLFETFYRVEKSRATATGGTGLGLAIAANIVSLHGGTIAAYNQPDQRTVFEVRLPLDSPA